MAVRNMRINPNTPVSESLGFNPRGVIVDNLTNYWLYFPQANQFCPPLTVGWTAPLLLHMAGYGYMEIKSPFDDGAQLDVTPNVSQYVELVWTDQAVTFSPGLPSNSGAVVDPTNTGSAAVLDVLNATTASVSAPVSGLTQQLIAAIPEYRIRLLTVNININLGSLVVLDGFDSPVSWHIAGNPGSRLANGTLDFAQPYAQLIFDKGVYFPVGSSIDFTARGFWANSSLIIRTTYQVTR